MKVDLEGRKALVTGAGSGIGRAIAATLVACGARVTALGSNRQKLEALSRDPEFRGRVDIFTTDLADTENIGEVAREISRETFDILINNAGINIHGLVGDMDMNDFDRS